MKIHELRKYLRELPMEFDEFDIVYSEVHELENTNIARKDIAIEALAIDQDNEEMVIGKNKDLDLL